MIYITVWGRADAFTIALCFTLIRLSPVLAAVLSVLIHINSSME